MAIENNAKTVHAIDYFMDLMENLGPDRFDLNLGTTPNNNRVRIYYNIKSKKVTTLGKLGDTFALTDITGDTWKKNAGSIESLIASVTRCLKTRAKRIISDLSTEAIKWEGRNLKGLSGGRITRGDVLPVDIQIHPDYLLEDLVEDCIYGKISITLPDSEILTMLNVDVETLVKGLENHIYDSLESDDEDLHDEILYLDANLLDAFTDPEYVVQLVLDLLEEYVDNLSFSWPSVVFGHKPLYPLLQKVKNIENIREQADGLLKRLADEHGDAYDMQYAPEFFEALGFEHVAVEINFLSDEPKRAYMSVQLLDADEIEFLTKNREVAYIAKLDRMHTGATGRLTILDINKMVNTTCYGVIDPLPGFNPGRVIQLSPRNLSSR